MVQYLVEQGVDVNKVTTDTNSRYTPLHAAVRQGHIDVAICLMERGMADLNARTTNDRRPMDLARNEEMREAIVKEEKRRRDHGFKRSVIPPTLPSTFAEQECDENEEERQALGGAVANADEEEEDEDDEDSSSSDEED